jgi:hypothetical protein
MWCQYFEPQLAPLGHLSLLESITYARDTANCVRPPIVARSLAGFSSMAAWPPLSQNESWIPFRADLGRAGCVRAEQRLRPWRAGSVRAYRDRWSNCRGNVRQWPFALHRRIRAELRRCARKDRRRVGGVLLHREFQVLPAEARSRWQLLGGDTGSAPREPGLPFSARHHGLHEALSRGSLERTLVRNQPAETPAGWMF